MTYLIIYIAPYGKPRRRYTYISNYYNYIHRWHQVGLIIMIEVFIKIFLMAQLFLYHVHNEGKGLSDFGEGEEETQQNFQLWRPH